MAQPLWKTMWQFLRKLDIELTYDPGISFLGKYPKIPKGIESKARTDLCTPTFIIALFTIAKRWEQPKYPSTDEWVNKMWYIRAIEYY